MTATELEPAGAVDILLPASAAHVQQAMNAYIETTRAVLDASDWQGPAQRQGSFIKKSGWQKIAKAYRLSTSVVSTEVDRDEDGRVVRAGVVMRAIAPNGQYREATGYCAVDEPRFARESGRQKLENDLRNTAATRAENRAISNLTGVGSVSAEETDGQPTHDLPGWVAPVDDVADVAHVLDAILTAAGADPARISAAVSTIGNGIFDECAGTVPTCVAHALELVAEAIPDPIPDVEVQT